MRSGLTRRSIEKLAEADAFRSLGLDRRDALWSVRALDPLSAAERLPLFAVANNSDLQNEPEVSLPPMLLGEHVINDYQSLSFSLKAHPVSFARDWLDRNGIVRNSTLPTVRSGRRLSVAGLVLVRQRPGSAKGVVFETIEDETGIANIIVWPKVFERYRAIVLGSRFISVKGRLQSQDGVIHLVAEHLQDLTPLLLQISEAASTMGGLANADEVRRPQEDIRIKISSRNILRRRTKHLPEPQREAAAVGAKSALRALPKGRNFH